MPTTKTYNTHSKIEAQVDYQKINHDQQKLWFLNQIGIRAPQEKLDQIKPTQHVIYLIDRSSSMGYNYQKVLNHINKINSYLSDAHHTVSAITFCRYIETSYTKVQPSDFDITQLPQRTNGGTNIPDALFQLSNLDIDDPEHTTVILLTDGQTDTGKQCINIDEAILEVKQHLKKQFPSIGVVQRTPAIYSIGYGDGYDLSQLQKIETWTRKPIFHMNDERKLTQFINTAITQQPFNTTRAKIELSINGVKQTKIARLPIIGDDENNLQSVLMGFDIHDLTPQSGQLKQLTLQLDCKILGKTDKSLLEPAGTSIRVLDQTLSYDPRHQNSDIFKQYINHKLQNMTQSFDEDYKTQAASLLALRDYTTRLKEQNVTVDDELLLINFQLEALASSKTAKSDVSFQSVKASNCSNTQKMEMVKLLKDSDSNFLTIQGKQYLEIKDNDLTNIYRKKMKESSETFGMALSKRDKGAGQLTLFDDILTNTKGDTLLEGDTLLAVCQDFDTRWSPYKTTELYSENAEEKLTKKVTFNSDSQPTLTGYEYNFAFALFLAKWACQHHQEAQVHFITSSSLNFYTHGLVFYKDRDHLFLLDPYYAPQTKYDLNLKQDRHAARKAYDEHHLSGLLIAPEIQFNLPHEAIELPDDVMNAWEQTDEQLKQDYKNMGLICPIKMDLPQKPVVLSTNPKQLYDEPLLKQYLEQSPKCPTTRKCATQDTIQYEAPVIVSLFKSLEEDFKSGQIELCSDAKRPQLPIDILVSQFITKLQSLTTEPPTTEGEPITSSAPINEDFISPEALLISCWRVKQYHNSQTAHDDETGHSIDYERTEQSADDEQDSNSSELNNASQEHNQSQTSNMLLSILGFFSQMLPNNPSSGNNPSNPSNN